MIQLAETLAKLKELPFTINELSFISGIQDDANAKVYSKYKEIDKAEKVNLWFKELTNDKSLFISADEIKRFRSVDVRDSGFSDFTAELNGLIFPDPNADNKYKVKYRSEAIDDSDLGNAVFEENSDFINFFNSNYIRYINQEGVELSRHDQLIKEKLTLLYELPLTQIEYLFNWTSSDVDNPAYSLYQVLFDKITQSGWSESEEVIEYITNSLEPIEKIQNIWTKFQIDDKDLLFTKSNSALIGLNSQFMINNFIGGGAINNYLELHYYFELKNRSIEEKIERKEFENILKSKTDWIANIPPTDPVLLESFLLLRPNISKILKIDTGILDVSIQSLRDIQEVQHSLDVLNDIQKISHVLTSTGLTTDAAITQLRSSDFISAQGYKTELRNFFQSKFDSLEDLDKASEEYLNRIEEHKRDVLCAFIMGMRNINKFDSTSDMYAWFLVDVEMSGCARVSEILAATLVYNCMSIE
ncbi:MAG: hypothetical protein IPL25_10240 [Saprospiraceae bacterium]|nr:hypothetical protein [Candidatus Vicinibacter affinis]